MQILSIVVVYRLYHLKFVFAAVSVIQRDLKFASNEVIQSPPSSIPLHSRQAGFRSFPSSFAFASGAVASVRRHVGPPASSSWQFIDITCLAFVLDGVVSVPQTIVCNAPTSWQVVGLFSFTLMSGAVTSVQPTEGLHAPSSGRSIKVVSGSALASGAAALVQLF